MVRSFFALAFTTACSLPLLAGASSAAELEKAVCSGTFGSGSGLAGSYVGDRCFIAADSDMQRRIAEVCGENAACEVEAMVRTDSDGHKQIEEVLAVKQLVAASQTSESYAARIGNYVDGILAPADQGCDLPNATPQKRVSVQLGRAGGGAIQLYNRYCAVIDASGQEPSDQGFTATLQVRCGRPAQNDAALRSGTAGENDTVRMSLSASRQLQIDDETMMRCPIKQAYTPQWWIEAPPFNGSYPK